MTLPTVDELWLIGDSQREDNRRCGMDQYGIDYLTRSWVNALVEFQGLSLTDAGELLQRWDLVEWAKYD